MFLLSNEVNGFHWKGGHDTPVKSKTPKNDTLWGKWKMLNKVYLEKLGPSAKPTYAVNRYLPGGREVLTLG